MIDSLQTQSGYPEPGSAEELASFAALQEGLPETYRRISAHPRAPRTVVVIPSMSLAAEELAKIDGVMHYEERMLCLLMLLRSPRTRLVYVTSLPLDPAVIDYYLHLLPGVPSSHARSRLDLISIGDGSLRPLSQKLIDRPEKLDEIKALIRDPGSANMTCFNTTHLERTVAVRLGIPLYATDPVLTPLGNKSIGRGILRESGLEVPYGHENLRDQGDIIEALADLHRTRPELSRAVIKLNEGFSGEGNVTFHMSKLDRGASGDDIRRSFEGALQFEAAAETWDAYEAKFNSMGGIVEAYIEGGIKASPSVQMRVDPAGEIHLVSTHDQVLSGPTGQVFLGCKFPAHKDYRMALHDAGGAVAATLQSRGVIGRFGIDFVSVKENDTWRHYAIEVNLRKGGTTLPFLMLQFLTDGTYHRHTGEFRTPAGAIRSYFASDNVVEPAFRGLSPADLIDVAVYEGIQYYATSQKGVVFHLIGAVKDFGKVGVVSIAMSEVAAENQYKRAVSLLTQSAALAGH